MSAFLKGFTIDKNGNVVPKKKHKSVSQRIREKNSKKQKPVSRARAELHSTNPDRK